MSDNPLAVDTAVYQEIGAAVVTALATRRALTIETLIELVDVGRHDEGDYGPERRQAMAVTVALLRIFI